MKKLYVSFKIQNENLCGYIDGYTTYHEYDYAVIYVPSKKKIYSIKVTELEIIGYKEV